MCGSVLSGDKTPQRRAGTPYRRREETPYLDRDKTGRPGKARAGARPRVGQRAVACGVEDQALELLFQSPSAGGGRVAEKRTPFVGLRY